MRSFQTILARSTKYSSPDPDACHGLGQFPKGKVIAQVPTLETPQGGVFESNAIARYVARMADKGLFGHTSFEAVWSPPEYPILQNCNHVHIEMSSCL